MPSQRAAKPDFSLELLYPDQWVAGVDEAGRGPWAGPVVAAAVVLDMQALPEGINDSKQLKPAAREALFTHIMMTARATGVGLATVEEIDRLNILHATMLAMQRAVAELAPAPGVALVDGNRKPPLSCPVQCVVGGDARSLSIAAASILAKVTRDRIMRGLAGEFPQYGFARNAGYGTPQHQLALAEHGVTPHHRKSFAPVKRMLEEACEAA